MQRLVVEEVLNHIICTKSQLRLARENQMLLYIRGEVGVGKSRVIKALQMGFNLLQRQNGLVIAAPTGCAAKGIGGNTIHIALSMNTRTSENRQVRPSPAWTRCSALIIDEISMIDLKLLATIDKQLQKAKCFSASSTAVFGGLSLVILTGNFYQFPPVIGQSFWAKTKRDTGIHGQTLRQSFTTVITLTEKCDRKMIWFSKICSSVRDKEN